MQEENRAGARRNSEVNDYGDTLEKWKSDLIVFRAKRKGFRPHEIQDAQQDIITAVLAFNFDASRSNGASEKTALTKVIDNRLTSIQRSRARQHQNFENYKRLTGCPLERDPCDRAPTPGKPDTSAQDKHLRQFDLREAVATLNPREQDVVMALLLGENILETARAMGMKRCAVNSMIDHIREQFQAVGLYAWVLRT